MKDIGTTASKLSRNPLGILALLIVLVYGIAGFVSTSSAFRDSDLSVMVWFLVLFPVIVLAALIYLVSKHHDKLYAPSDFTNEENFVSLIDQSIAKSEQFIELNNSAKNIEIELDAISAKDSDSDDNTIVEGSQNNLVELTLDQQNILRMLRDGQNTYRSISGLSKDTGCSKAVVRDALFELEQKSLSSSRDRGNGPKYFINYNGRQWLQSANKQNQTDT